MVETHIRSANNLLTLENASGLLKTLLPRCPIVFELLIRPSNPLLHPSVHDYPIKKCIQFYLAFEQREQEKRRDLPYQNHAITHFHA